MMIWHQNVSNSWFRLSATNYSYKVTSKLPRSRDKTARLLPHQNSMQTKQHHRAAASKNAPMRFFSSSRRVIHPTGPVIFQGRIACPSYTGRTLILNYFKPWKQQQQRVQRPQNVGSRASFLTYAQRPAGQFNLDTKLM